MRFILILILTSCFCFALKAQNEDSVTILKWISEIEIELSRDIKKSDSLLMKAELYQLKTGFRGLEVPIKIKRGSYWFMKGDYEQSLHYQYLALKLALQKKQDQYLSSIYGNMAPIFYEKKNYPKALEYYNKGIEYAAKNKQLNIELHLQNGIASVYGNLGDIEKALESFNLIYQKSKKAGENDLIIQALNNISLCYFELGETTKAIAYTDTLINRAKASNNQYGLCYVYLNAASYILPVKRYDQALQYITEAEKLAKSNDYKSLLIRILERKSEIFELRGNSKKALQIFNQYISSSEEVFNLEKEKILDELDLKYKEELKRSEILKLNNEILQKENNNSFTAVLIFMLIALIAAVVVILYNSLQNAGKQKKINQELTKTLASIEQMQMEISNVNAQLEEENRQLEKANIKTKISNLFVQSNPDLFLFLLDRLAEKIKANNPNAQQFNLNLANYLKDQLQHKDQIIVTVEKELQNLRLFLQLLSDEHPELDIQISESGQNLCLPANALLQLVFAFHAQIIEKLEVQSFGNSLILVNFIGKLQQKSGLYQAIQNIKQTYDLVEFGAIEKTNSAGRITFKLSLIDEA